MGIKGLTSLLRDKSPDCIESIALSQYRGKRVAIDISIFLYKSLSNVRYNGDYLRNSEGKVVSHLIGIFNKTVLYLSVGITPIYIFDGKPPDEKRECIQERKDKVEENKKKLEHGGLSDSEKCSLEKSTIRLKREHIEDIKHLFDLMGVGYIHNEVGEAEAYAAELCRMGCVHAVVTEDMDTLAYGCPRIIRGCLDRTNKRNDVVSCISYDKIIEGFSMTHDQFVDVCILCGCDYCPTIPKIGPIRAYQYITNYKTIEAMIESNKFTISNEFRERYLKSRELFQIFQNKIDPEELPLHQSERRMGELRDYLRKDCGLSEKKVENALRKISINP